MTDDDVFRVSMRAFDLFTLAEREAALEHFAQLEYPSIRDRFHEAVYRIISEPRGQEPRTHG